MTHKPYQPLLLRLLHGINGFLILGAWITGYWAYNTYDGRWGKISLPAISGIIDLHGTLALGFFLVIPAFALYSFHPGQRRLLQPNSLVSLGQIGRPIWWVNVHRLTNTLMLLAATLAALTGRMMDETWLPAQELNHTWYYAHLMAWLVMGISLAVHILLGAKVGGVPLLLSMFDPTIHPTDHPKHWPQQVRQAYQRFWGNFPTDQ